MELGEHMAEGWALNRATLEKQLVYVFEDLGELETAALWTMLEVVFLLGGSNMLKAAVRENLMREDGAKKVLQFSTDAMDAVELKAIQMGIDLRKEGMGA